MKPASRAIGAEPPRIAVIGTGIAGAACASALLRAGLDVTAFDKSRGVGGRLAARRAEVADAQGGAHSVRFEHGCGPFTPISSRFAAAVDRLVAQGAAVHSRRRVYAEFPAPKFREVVAPVPDMPAICRQLLVGVPLRLGQAVTALQRVEDGWRLTLADGTHDGPFDRVVVAIPAPQAAVILKGCDDAWADALASVPMAPCWTLMAVTDELDWPWDAAELSRGELAWIGRGDRVRGVGVSWVAHASTDWSRAHLEDEPDAVRDALSTALRRSLGAPAGLRFHHAAVHRWRYAGRLAVPSNAFDGTHLIGRDSGLAVCGDAFGEGVEAAWCSGDDLALALIASLVDRPAAPIRPAAAAATAPIRVAAVPSVASVFDAPVAIGSASAIRPHRRTQAAPSRSTAPAGESERSASDAHS